MTDHDGPEGEQRCSTTLSLTSSLDEDMWLHAPVALRPGKRPSTHCTVGWVGPCLFYVHGSVRRW